MIADVFLVQFSNKSCLFCIVKEDTKIHAHLEGGKAPLQYRYLFSEIGKQFWNKLAKSKLCYDNLCSFTELWEKDILIHMVRG